MEPSSTIRPASGPHNEARSGRGRLKIKINTETCIRAGRCYFDHPDLLQEGEDGFPVPLAKKLGEAQRQVVLDAIENCPTQSISLEEDSPFTT